MSGSEFTITTKELLGTSKIASINYENFPKDVQEGEMVLINDGKIQIQVTETNKKDTVKTKVLHGGPLSSNKG